MRKILFTLGLVASFGQAFSNPVNFKWGSGEELYTSTVDSNRIYSQKVLNIYASTLSESIIMSSKNSVLNIICKEESDILLIFSPLIVANQVNIIGNNVVINSQIFTKNGEFQDIGMFTTGDVKINGDIRASNIRVISAGSFDFGLPTKGIFHEELLSKFQF